MAKSGYFSFNNVYYSSVIVITLSDNPSSNAANNEVRFDIIVSSAVLLEDSNC